MMSIARIFLRVFIEPFFRENTGGFIFFYTLLIFAVGHLDGQGMIYYHHTLIVAMLTKPDIFLLVCFIWLLYVIKCLSFVNRALQKPDNGFWYAINGLSFGQRYAWSVLSMAILFFPVGWYGLLIIGVGFYERLTFAALGLTIYLLLLCLLPALRIVRRMQSPGLRVYRRSLLRGGLFTYPILLMRFVLSEQKVLYFTIKLFTCALVYGFTRINEPDAYYLQFPFLFFSLGMLANGILIHRIRSFEEVFMLSYRGTSISLLRRLADYILFYGCVLIPEFLTLASLTSVHLHYFDALNFALTGFGLVLLINSICLLEDFTMNEYLRVILVVLCVQFIFVLSETFTGLYILYLLFAVILFFKNYYLFEKRPRSGNG